jgi:hypothetical protein
MEKTGQKLTEAGEVLKKATYAIGAYPDGLDGMVVIISRGQNIEVFNSFETGKELYTVLATLAAEVVNPDGAVYAANRTLQ